MVRWSKTGFNNFKLNFVVEVEFIGMRGKAEKVSGTQNSWIIKSFIKIMTELEVNLYDIEICPLPHSQPTNFWFHSSNYRVNWWLYSVCAPETNLWE